MGKALDGIKEKFGTAKTKVHDMPKKHKIIGAVIIVLILAAIALCVTMALYANRDAYVPLYSSELEATEASEIYVQLQKMGADARMDATTGQIMVRQSQYDLWLLQLAGEGYPQSALPYSVFESHTGMTTTEAESEEWLLKDLQDRMQATLKRMTGVNSATVTISPAESSDYVWQSAANDEPAKASVLLRLSKDVILTPEQVDAVKNLVAFSVPKMEPGNVSVTDADTMQELSGTPSEEDGVTNAQNLELEQQVQRQMEQKVERLLAARYGTNGVVAVANVTLNYDAMITESMTPTTRADGSAYIDEYKESYAVNGEQIAGGIVGEENNTDIPGYAYTNPNNNGGMTNYWRDITNVYGYIKTQVEKGNAILEDASMAVMVDETNMDAARTAELIGLISTATNIDTNKISVAPIQTTLPEDTGETDITTTVSGLPIWLFIALGVVVLLLILVIVLIALRAKKRKEEDEALAAAQAEEAARAASQVEMESEIDAYKRALTEGARSESNAKEDAIVDEIRDFAKQNPEITANLIRAWLKEDE